jgi:hypothetical protein
MRSARCRARVSNCRTSIYAFCLARTAPTNASTFLRPRALPSPCGAQVQTIGLPSSSGGAGVNTCNFYGSSNTGARGAQRDGAARRSTTQHAAILSHPPSVSAAARFPPTTHPPTHPPTHARAEGKLTTTVTGDRLVVPCYNAPVGTLFSSITSFTAAVVGFDGGVDTSTTVATASAVAFRGLASADGTYFYAGTSAGLRGFAYGATAATTTMTTLTSATSGSLASVGFAAGGGLHGSWISSPYGVVRPYASAPYPTAAATTLLSTTVLPGTATAGSLTSGFHFADAATLFTCAYGTSGSVGHLQKYALSGTTWAQPAGWPKLNLPYVAPGGGTVTPTGIKSVAGAPDPVAGAYVLYLVTSTGTSGGNALLRFNTATEAVAHVATAPAYVNWQAVAWAPVPPSATPTITATPSFGASASPSGTPPVTATPTRTSTPSGTATPSPTGTALCAPPTASPAPFGAGNLAVLRVGAGSGRDIVGTAAVAREAFIDEYTPGGALVQSIALPTGAPVYNGSGGLVSSGCTINTAFLNNGLLTRAGDGRSLALACLPLAPGAVPAAGVSKTVVSVGADGSVTAVALMNSYYSALGSLTSDGGGTSVTGAVTPDGFN